MAEAGVQAAAGCKGGVRLWGLWTSCSFVNTALGSHVQIWLQGTCAGRKGVQLLAPIHLCVSR